MNKGQNMTAHIVRKRLLKVTPKLNSGKVIISQQYTVEDFQNISELCAILRKIHERTNI